MSDAPASPRGGRWWLRVLLHGALSCLGVTVAAAASALVILPVWVRGGFDSRQPWAELFFTYAFCFTPLVVVTILIIRSFLARVPELRPPRDSPAGNYLPPKQSARNTSATPWVRVSMLSLAAAAVMALAANAWATLERTDGLTLGAAVMLSVLTVKLAADALAKWSRCVWLPICTSIGLVALALALHWAALDYVEQRATSPALWGAPYELFFHQAGPYILLSIPLGTISGMGVLRSAAVKRRLHHLTRACGALAAVALAVLVTLAATTASPPGQLPAPPPSDRAPAHLELRELRELRGREQTLDTTHVFGTPAGWVSLGATALVCGVALFAGSMLLARFRSRSATQPIATQGYREAAAQAEPASAALDEAQLVASLRWETFAVAIVCVGLAPLLAAARGGVLMTAATSSVCGDGEVTDGEQCDDGNTDTELLCPTEAACTVCNEHCSLASISALEPAVSVGVCRFDRGSWDVTGYQFRVGATPLVVSQLAFYDQGSDGLGESHDVGIFEAISEKLVVSATVPAGTVAPESGGFRYVSVPPTVLTASTRYAILAHRRTSVDAVADSCATFTPNPFLEYQRDLAASEADSLTFTAFSSGEELAPPRWFGPSFRATTHGEP